MADGRESAPVRPRGRHRSSDDDDEAATAVDETLVAVDTTPTGRHSRLELEEMLAADGLDAPEIAPEPADSERPAAPTILLDKPAASTAEPETPNAPTVVLDKPTAPTAVLDRPAAPESPDEEPTAAPAKPNRAGRNLPAAVGVGVGLGAVVVASLAFRREAFLVLVLIAVAYGVYELWQAFKAGGIDLPVIPLVVGGIAMDIGAWARGADGLVVGVLLTCLGVVLWRIAEGPAGYVRDAGAGVFVALYVPFLAGFAVLLAHPHDGAGRIIAFVVTVVCSDVGGYAVGVLIGRHPMAPMVSPKKSWEGFAGSTVACVIAGSLLFGLLFHQPWWQGALYGLAIVVTATLGDLGESMLKRGLGIKDMGTLLPGHGGLMDRLDSLLPSAAVAYLFLSALVT